MKERRLLPYSRVSWFRRFMNVLRPFILPLIAFQGIRTLFYPSFFDFFLLLLLFLIYAGMHLRKL